MASDLIANCPSAGQPKCAKHTASLQIVKLVHDVMDKWDAIPARFMQQEDIDSVGAESLERAVERGTDAGRTAVETAFARVRRLPNQRSASRRWISGVPPKVSTAASTPSLTACATAARPTRATRASSACVQ